MINDVIDIRRFTSNNVASFFTNFNGCRYADHFFSEIFLAFANDRLPKVSRFNDYSFWFDYDLVTLSIGDEYLNDIVSNNRENQMHILLSDYENISKAEEYFNKKPEFTRLKDVEVYLYSKTKECNEIYINKDLMSAFVIVDNNRIKIGTNKLGYVHLLTTMIPRLFPKMFIDKPVTSDEINLMEAIIADDKDSISVCLNKLYENCEFDKRIAEKIIKEFETTEINNRINKFKNEFDEITYRMAELLKQYADFNTRKNEVSDLYRGALAARDNMEAGSLSRFIENNKERIKIEPCDSGELKFTVYTKLENFNRESFEKIYLRNLSVRNWNDDDLRLIAKNIFGENNRFDLKMMSTFTIGRNKDINVFRDFDLKDRKHFPNPHHYFYSCLGDNGRLIADFLVEGDTIGAIIQCIGCTESVNVHESVTTERMYSFLFGDYKNDKILIDKKTGLECSILDALKILKEESNQ